MPSTGSRRSLSVSRTLARVAGLVTVLLVIAMCLQWAFGYPHPIRLAVTVWCSLMVGGLVGVVVWGSPIGAVSVGLFVTTALAVASSFGTAVLARWAFTSEVPNLDRVTLTMFGGMSLLAGLVAQTVKGKL